MNKQYNIILRAHGFILLGLGLVMTLQTLLGTFKGIGALKFIEGDALRSVGHTSGSLQRPLLPPSRLVFTLQANYKKEWYLLVIVHLIPLQLNLLFW
ncbi:MAG: hypothetical protein IPN22_08625 [Bacteroidetes bacterium]|nr:hypothetical protein [Bacteroidota bacterium]